jgi:hypothetical protein
MMIKKPRVNVTFDEKTVAHLTSLARQENKSISGLTKELVIEALEIREDIALSDIAHKRDVIHEKRVNHKDAWK